MHGSGPGINFAVAEESHEKIECSGRAFAPTVAFKESSINKLH